MIQTLQLGIPIARSEALCGLTMTAINAYNKTAYKEQPTLLHRVPRHRGGRHRAGRAGAGDRHASTAARTSSGRPSPRSATGCGRRATRPTSPACSCAPARARCRPTSACRSRGWPSASSRPTTDIEQRLDADPALRPRRRRQLPLHDPDRPDERSRPRGGEGVQRAPGRCARSPWTAPAPASTASASARSSRSRRSTAKAVDLMRAIKRTFDPENLLNPGKVVPL